MGSDARPLLDPGPGLTEDRVRLPDDRFVRTVVAGSGGPLVVFEAGIGVGASVWVTVQPLVAAETRTLAYDRAGLGGSTEDLGVRSLERLVADLTAIVDRVEPSSPVVLVGSSLGGPMIRLLALTHPSRVAGMVFVDGAVADATPDWQMRRLKRGFSLAAALSRAGLHKPLIMAAMKPAVAAPMPPEARAVLIRDFTAARNLRAAAREAREVGLSVSALRSLEAGELPDVPMTTIVGGRTGPRESSTLRAAMFRSGRHEMENRPQGRFVVARQSSHAIPSEEPELVANEITRIVRTARRADR